jgi:hypothetical protein
MFFRGDLDVIRWLQRRARHFGAIALIAILFRALVPFGYVLAEADTGSGHHLTLKLCSAHSPQVVDHGPQGHGDDNAKGGKQNKDEPKPPTCVCSPAASMQEPFAAIVTTEFSVSREPRFVAGQDLHPGHGIAAPPPPSTGPPIVA